jgi:hypothetical protein
MKPTDNEEGLVASSNKPSNSQFRQQRLVAWQPVMSPPHTVGCLVILAAFFIPVGVAILLANNSVVDVEVRYDAVRKCTNNDNDGLLTYNNGSSQQGCYTTVNFTVPKDMKAPVFLYYKLTNFYQNHRTYAKSRSVNQLAGIGPGSTTNTDCAPFYRPGENDGAEGTDIDINGAATKYNTMRYAPCGLVPWSMFNDSFALFNRNATHQMSGLICNGAAFDKADASDQLAAGTHYCHKKGIAWESDYEKYKQPIFFNDVWTAKRSYYNRSDQPTTTDKYFLNGWYANEDYHEVPVTTDEDLMIWMRTATLPTFRKIHRIIDVDMPAGDYTMAIAEYFDVSSFGGTKSFALSTVSVFGGENVFLGYVYVIVGGLCFLLAVGFLIAYQFSGNRMAMAVAYLNEYKE